MQSGPGMKVTLKLFANLSGYLPADARRSSRIDLEVAPGATIRNLVDQVRVPPERCALVLVNGEFVPERDRDGWVLRPDDILAIWPPVGGG